MSHYGVQCDTVLLCCPSTHARLFSSDFYTSDSMAGQSFPSTHLLFLYRRKYRCHVPALNRVCKRARGHFEFNRRLPPMTTYRLFQHAVDSLNSQETVCFSVVR